MRSVGAGESTVARTTSYVPTPTYVLRPIYVGTRGRVRVRVRSSARSSVRGGVRGRGVTVPLGVDS